MHYNDLNFHDSELLSAKVTTDVNGDDYVELEIDFIVDYSDPSKVERKYLVFRKCQHASFSFNLGLVASESILDGSIKEHSPLLDAVKHTLLGMGATIPTNLKHYSIAMNTSGSTIDVIAESWTLE